MYIYIIALTGFIFLLLSSLNKKKEKILLFSSFTYILYSLQYLLLNAKCGYIISIINLIRTYLITVKDKHKLLKNNILLFIFIIIYIVIGYFIYQDLFSLLPIIAAIIYTSCLWQNDVKEIKLGAIINGSLWMIYDFHVASYVCFIGDFVITIINLVMYKRMCKDGKINKRKTKFITR